MLSAKATTSELSTELSTGIAKRNQNPTSQNSFTGGELEAIGQSNNDGMSELTNGNTNPSQNPECKNTRTDDRYGPVGVSKQANDDAAHSDNPDKFIAFARVYSGVIKTGQKLFVLGPKHDPFTDGVLTHEDILIGDDDKYGLEDEDVALE